MQEGSIAFRLTVLSLLMCASACEGLVDSGTNPPPPGNTGSGTGGTVSPPPDAGSAPGTGGTAPATPSPDAGASGGGGGTGGAGGAVVPGGSGGAGGSTTGDCTYPTAPELTAARFAVGTVAPNLTFYRENGSTLTFKDIYCNKKNRLLVWAIGGDLCSPCIGSAKVESIPAWKEMAPAGLFILEDFNGKEYLVSKPPKNPFAEWRGFTMWPADADGIALVKDPPTMPYYYVGRVVTLVLPNTIVIDVATMKVVQNAYHLTGGVGGLRSRLAALPMRQ